MTRRPVKTNRKKRSNNSLDIQKKIIQGILFVGILALLIVFLFGDHGMYELYSLKNERKLIQGEINELREKKINLESEKLKLETDYKYIEELAREKYRMAKKGEKVYKVIEGEN